MHHILLLLFLAGSTYGWLPVEQWGSGNVTGTVGEFGQCICNIFLPDTMFPADRVDIVQITSNKLTTDVEVHINKVIYIKAQLVILLSELTNLTTRVEILESGPDKYIKLEFDLLRVELREFESLVTHLKASLNSTSPVFDILYHEIHNMSLTVDQLESYDKSNLEVIRLEFIKLQKKLEKCRDEQDDFSNAAIGSCKHGGILKLSKPVVSQLNADLSGSYLYGGWGKDSNPVPGYENMYCRCCLREPPLHTGPTLRRRARGKETFTLGDSGRDREQREELNGFATSWCLFVMALKCKDESYRSSHLHMLRRIAEGKERRKHSEELWCVRETDENGEGMVTSQTCSSSF
ncbi:hypothetical protein Q7C36_011827 [Tachysurus vachellii]|uniref:Uncharacterized protein n=1 Tax=Tachysurus vachellii TaxID=175792 RepID=A0AA88MV19_TACVA|nr:hypothetical protein Q7C36_011827 [Tachysurus vachellii]